MPRDLYASVSLLRGWLLSDKLLGGTYPMNEVLGLQAVELILGCVWGAWGPLSGGLGEPQGPSGGSRGPLERVWAGLRALRGSLGVLSGGSRGALGRPWGCLRDPLGGPWEPKGRPRDALGGSQGLPGTF